MDATFYALAGLAASVAANFALLLSYRNARRQADMWRASEQYMIRAYERLRRSSHRRDPKTGRLMPKGE